MKIRIFGESHAPEIGVEIEGVPKGTVIDGTELQAFLDRRAPGNGQGGMSTPRKEPDRVEFESGIVRSSRSGKDSASPLSGEAESFPLLTDGNVIRAVIRNTNTRPQDYANVQTVPRPGHADYASWLQCGKIPTGGGKWSGRMTAPLCIAGGIALQMLKRRGVTIAAKVIRCGGMDCGGETPPPLNRIPAGDSVGGIVEVVATGFPAGYGDVGTDGLESKLAAAFFGIPAVKGVEFGDGFKLADMLGSEANDAFEVAGCEVAGPRGCGVRLRTNHCGGILGGVSVGMPIVARLVFKPTPSIAIEQDSVDLAKMAPAKITVKGRHDRCVAFRGAVAVEAAMALVLADELRGCEVAGLKE